MPTAYIKKVAKKTGKSVEDVEQKWKKAKGLADKTLPDDKYWGSVTAIFKKLMGIKESDEMIKEIKKNGKVIAEMEFKDGKWILIEQAEEKTIEQKLQALTEQSDEINIDMKIADVLRVLQGARYFTYASMREYENNSNNSISGYDNTTNKINMTDCEVSISGTVFEVDDGEKSFSFDLEDFDSFNICGGNSLMGLSEKGEKLVRMSFYGSVKDNGEGKCQHYDLNFVYAMPK